MPYKYCEKCDKLIYGKPNFCSWCSNDLKNHRSLDDVNTWEEQQTLHSKEREMVKAKAINLNIDARGQIKLF